MVLEKVLHKVKKVALVSTSPSTSPTQVGIPTLDMEGISWVGQYAQVSMSNKLQTTFAGIDVGLIRERAQDNSHEASINK